MKSIKNVWQWSLKLPNGLGEKLVLYLLFKMKSHRKALSCIFVALFFVSCSNQRLRPASENQLLNPDGSPRGASTQCSLNGAIRMLSGADTVDQYQSEAMHVQFATSSGCSSENLQIAVIDGQLVAPLVAPAARSVYFSASWPEAGLHEKTITLAAVNAQNEVVTSLQLKTPQVNVRAASTTASGGGSNGDLSCSASMHGGSLKVSPNYTGAVAVAFEVTGNRSFYVSNVSPQGVSASIHEQDAYPTAPGPSHLFRLTLPSLRLGTFAVKFSAREVREVNGEWEVLAAECYAIGVIEQSATGMSRMPDGGFQRTGECPNGSVVTGVDFDNQQVTCGDVSAAVDPNQCVAGIHRRDFRDGANGIKIDCPDGYVQTGSGAEEMDSIQCCALKLEINTGNTKSSLAIAGLQFLSKKVIRSSIDLLDYSACVNGVSASELNYALPGGADVACPAGFAQTGSDNGSVYDTLCCPTAMIPQAGAGVSIGRNELITGVNFVNSLPIKRNYAPEIDPTDCTAGQLRENADGAVDAESYSCPQNYVQVGTDDRAVGGIACCRVQFGQPAP